MQVDNIEGTFTQTQHILLANRRLTFMKITIISAMKKAFCMTPQASTQTIPIDTAKLQTQTRNAHSYIGTSLHDPGTRLQQALQDMLRSMEE